MKYKSIYVAATSQHVGKTTSTLGLVTAFMSKGINVGYCKPVGQRFVDVQNIRVDKDALLFSDVMHFQLQDKLHSPVILGPGATAEYIDHPEAFDYVDRIRFAADTLEAAHELVIFEGTGHPGVGSVVNLSNADVAKMIGAKVIMVVEGGIGNTIDMLTLCLSKFEQKGVPVSGVIINKVIEEKQEKVKHYVGKKLDQLGIPLLGMLPYDKSMVFPLIRTVAESVNGIIVYNEDRMFNKVQDILAGSLLGIEELKSKDLLLVVSTVRADSAIEKIESISRLFNYQESPLSGIIATGQGSLGNQTIEYIKKHKVPLIRTALDTYGSVLKISRIEVKINQNTPWKVKRAIEMIGNSVHLESLLEEI